MSSLEKEFTTRFPLIITSVNLIGNIIYNYSYFSKVVGIFLDLEDEIIMKLINDDHYFNTQVAETIKVIL